ncbi:hypothetical protein FUAX_44220 (plasmid) [Fulvitalea axinellae]|uniref:Type IX secretion system membrane protein PorP/SprF n=1 Tax=Fulvitalea axinellae TaxID=1182444 RepID=A0AAU9CRI1_9BACT|nr:hypothetical protein FUAX_44220 [Fulvitalea axinellae]
MDRKIIFFFAIQFFCLGHTLKGQSDIGFKQYYQTPQALNPAYAGSNPYWSFSMGYGAVSLGQGLRADNYLVAANFVFPYDQMKNYGVNALKGRRPDIFVRSNAKSMGQGKSYRSGMGISAHRQSSGWVSQTQLQVAYAIHVPLSRKLRISGGAGFVLSGFEADQDGIFVRDELDPVYRSFVENGGANTAYGIRVGLALHGENFYGGYAFSRKVGESGFNLGNVSVLNVHRISGGYRLPLAGNTDWLNSCMLNVYEKKTTVAVVSQIEYKERIRAGVIVSPDEYFSLIAGVLIQQRGRVDITVSQPMGGEGGISDNKTLLELGLSVFCFRYQGQKRRFW